MKFGRLDVKEPEFKPYNIVIEVASDRDEINLQALLRLAQRNLQSSALYNIAESIIKLTGKRK